MNRDESLRALGTVGEWDVLIIGGGATGLGCAVDAATRGYLTALLERGDFANGTSSRSTKLIHGGVRYLRQGNFALVREALHERKLLLQNAPGAVRSLDFVLPVYSRWEAAFYGAGLKVYDLLGGSAELGKSRLLSKNEALERLPNLRQKGLVGGVLYHDAQFDDARFAIDLAETFHALGGTAANYVEVSDFMKAGGRIAGVKARDLESGQTLEITARVVINATGVFSDEMRLRDSARAPKLIAASRGSHLVVASDFLGGTTAAILPKTPDKRVFFAIPWRGVSLLGTTDEPVEEISAQPRIGASEIEALLRQSAALLEQPPERSSIRSVFAGLRPLVNRSATRDTGSLSREHQIEVSAAGLVSIVGGKWTTYRRMAAETVDRAASIAGLPARASGTESLRISAAAAQTDELSDAALSRFVHEEMARTSEDILARRTRLLFTDTREALRIAPAISEKLKRLLGWSDERAMQDIAAFAKIAEAYLPR